ncbi:hypothetical protein LPJ38_20915 [Bradyrhizobium daqingense]|uniref:hypothetical protein n=1 Tax=Bradyrhizobium daqingense TaxID=993502 RepID=UPI0013151511|nr:hypothetical protein [Bradyrhizobium daqingense]UFS86146.1 hypothetical protein LPJ38_20915 [Bradyrhizobium daqingense]
MAAPENKLEKLKTLECQFNCELSNDRNAKVRGRPQLPFTSFALATLQTIGSSVGANST